MILKTRIVDYFFPRNHQRASLEFREGQRGRGQKGLKGALGSRKWYFLMIPFHGLTNVDHGEEGNDEGLQ
jgi:hypothetical protein